MGWKAWTHVAVQVTKAEYFLALDGSHKICQLTRLLLSYWAVARIFREGEMGIEDRDGADIANWKSQELHDAVAPVVERPCGEGRRLAR